jgi:hypothetical protein
MAETKRFGSFTAEVEVDDVDGSICCYISKGDFCSSLALLEDMGEIENGNGDREHVPSATITAISKWAEYNGY